MLKGTYAVMSYPGPFMYGDFLWRNTTLCTSDQSGAETTTLHNTTHNRLASMPPVGFEPSIPASDWPQNHALEPAATGIAVAWLYVPFNCGLDPANATRCQGSLSR
jgi:hypothetical protein